jgi:iron(III) transport system permease protein
MLPTAIIAFYYYQRSFSQMNLSNLGMSAWKNENYRFPLPRFLSIPLGLTVGLFFLVMVLKYGNIFLSTVSNTSTGVLTFTDRYIREIPLSFFKSFRSSILLSVTAGIVAPILGILLAYYVHRRKMDRLKPIEFIASLPFIIPGTFYGLGYVAAFSHQPIMIRGTYLILITNLIYRQVSVSNKTANSFFVTLDNRIENASSDLGASRVQTLAKIIFPLTRPIFYTSFISIFTSSMTSMGAIAFIVMASRASGISGFSSRGEIGIELIC